MADLSGARFFPFNDKYRGSFILRMSGMTLKEAGDVLGVSAERVREMQHVVERVLNRTAQQRERELWRETPRGWYGRAVPVDYDIKTGGRRT
jgi:hypothetical protein